LKVKKEVTRDSEQVLGLINEQIHLKINTEAIQACTP